MPSCWNSPRRSSPAFRSVIGLVNATLGLFLKIITFPLTILTLGLFWFVINAIMLELASAFVPGFQIGNRAGQRDAGAVFEDHYLPAYHPHLGTILVCDQCHHAGTRLGVRPRLSDR